MIRPVVERTDELLAERGQHPLPLGVTAHKLRHSFASILVALGKDPRYVMAQLGHEDPHFTMRVYAHTLRFSDDKRARLRAFVGGEEWAHHWAPRPLRAPLRSTWRTRCWAGNGPLAGGSWSGRSRVRTGALLLVRQAL